MSETNKTLAFLALTAAACLGAYVSQPSTADFHVEDQVGEVLFPEFDSEKAKRMKITRFDEDAASLSTFEVAQKGRLWTLPSKDGYPADAEDQMAKAVDGVREREILSVASKSAADHSQYGVIDPDSPKLDVGQTGVGTRVTLLDESDQPLVDLIIGKKVRDTEDQYFVRRATQDFVYVVKINQEDFSTSFEDWIEDDLLKISPWDIKQVRLNDYSAKLFSSGGRPGIELDYRSDMTLKYDDANSKWAPVELKKALDPRGEKFEAFSLAEDEELNEDKLRDLKSALDDLRLVDVTKKPAGMSANLKAGAEFMNDEEALVSLINRGFAPMGGGDGPADILSSDGEVVCTMKDGVEYVLRFGDIQISSAEGDQKPEEGEQTAEKAVNRYLFVMARFNKASIESPEIEILPELPKDAPKQDDAETDEAKASEEEDKEEAKKDDETATDDADKDNAAKAEGDKADGKQADLEAVIAERKEIEQRNQQKLNEYASKLEEGQKKVDQLNARFGDWYYVIPNDVFKKIHLGRDDVIKKKEAKEGEEGAEKPSETAAGAPGAPVPGLPDVSSVEPKTTEPKATEPKASEPESSKPEADEPKATEPKEEATESKPDDESTETPSEPSEDS